MSPYIPAGTVFQEPQGPYGDSQFDLSSICSTAKHLFGVPGFLTRRDAWAGSFHELLTLNEPRTDAPMHLPDGPPIHAERADEREHRRRLMQQQRHEGMQDGHHEVVLEEAEPIPRHCSAAPVRALDAGECAAEGGGVTMKQRNRFQVFAAMTNTVAPTETELATMTKDDAAQWQHQRWAQWIGHGLGWRQRQERRAEPGTVAAHGQNGQ